MTKTEKQIKKVIVSENQMYISMTLTDENNTIEIPFDQYIRMSKQKARED